LPGQDAHELAVVIEQNHPAIDEVELDSRDMGDSNVHRDFRKNMIVASVSSANVAIVLAIVWNLIGVEWPLALATVTKNLAKAFWSSTMFSVGVIAKSHPMTFGYWAQVCGFLIVHHLINPAIAMGWAFALRMDTVSARACVLLWAMPADWTGAWLADKRGSPRNAITATVLWSQILAVPLFFCWLAVLGETRLFA
jgi:predicted permease